MIDERTRLEEHFGKNIGHGDGRFLFFNECPRDETILHLGGRTKSLRSDVSQSHQHQSQKEERKQYHLHLSVAWSFFFSHLLAMETLVKVTILAILVWAIISNRRETFDLNCVEQCEMMARANCRIPEPQSLISGCSERRRCDNPSLDCYQSVLQKCMASRGLARDPDRGAPALTPFQ